MQQDEIRKLIDAESEKNPTALPSPSVVAVGNRPAALPGRFTQRSARTGPQAVLDAMQGKLQIQLPSDFDGAAGLSQAAGQAGLPDHQINGFRWGLTLRRMPRLIPAA
jgi:hypothetical protein